MLLPPNLNIRPSRPPGAVRNVERANLGAPLSKRPNKKTDSTKKDLQPCG